MTLPADLRGNPWPDVSWDGGDRPLVLVDGVRYRAGEWPVGPVRGQAAYVVGCRQEAFDALVAQLDVERLQLYDMRVADVGALRRLPSLQHLAIRWNTKLSDLAPLAGLPLRSLVLDDTPKARDLAPLATLLELQHLELTGGVWSRNTAASLEPLGALPRLEELALLNLKVESGGLRPLAGCHALRRLRVSNQFETADYAYLAARLPAAECSRFAPYTRLDPAIGDKDTMITGRRKPLLDSRKDAERIARYELAFWEMQRRFLDEA